MIQIISSVLLFFYMLYIPELVNCGEFKIVLPNSNVHSGLFTIRGLSYNIGAPCITKEGIKGKCLAKEDCPELSQLIKSRGGIHSRGTMHILQKRYCGFHNKEAYCCQMATEIASPSILPASPSILPTLDCGIPTARRIHGGDNITRGAHPWLVGVGYKDSRNSVKISCGGTLITKKHVLTAAHCFVRDPRTRSRSHPSTHVILGEHSRSEVTEKIPPLILQIADRKNPGFDSSTFYNDIELLILEKEVTFTNYIRPACLPIDNFVKDFNLKNSEIEIVGWGMTSLGNLQGSDTPQQALVYMVPLSKCQEVYGNVEGAKIDESQICLLGDGKDACKGDSGGPAIYEGTKNFFLVGITSFGDWSCRATTLPGVYTYVPAYMKWIVSNL